jgi:hypothetical protein
MLSAKLTLISFSGYLQAAYFACFWKGDFHLSTWTRELHSPCKTNACYAKREWYYFIDAAAHKEAGVFDSQEKKNLRFCKPGVGICQKIVDEK